MATLRNDWPARIKRRESPRDITGNWGEHMGGYGRSKGRHRHPAIDPDKIWDDLAAHAIREDDAGDTVDIRQFAADLDISLNER